MTVQTPWMRETEVFAVGAEGYHTFRIPALVVANDGTILAFCEGRKQPRTESRAANLVLKRSTDNGLTWGDLQVLAGDGQRTMHNPTALVDRDTGTAWVSFNIDVDTVHVMSSDDSGATWSDPVDITRDVKPPSWTSYALAPGHGVQLKSGTLMIPAAHSDGTHGDPPFSNSHVISSDDHGSSWKVGGILPEGSGECELVETHDGSLYMDARANDRSLMKRVCSWSNDGGATWSELEGVDALPDPICQASIVRFTDRDNHDRDRILFSNAASASRDTLTVRVSYDECRSWSASKVLCPGPASYSELAIASDMTIACLYEKRASYAYNLVLAQFNIEWLTDGADHLE